MERDGYFYLYENKPGEDKKILDAKQFNSEGLFKQDLIQQKLMILRCSILYYNKVGKS